MSDFLNFLNTADMDVLVKIPGVTRTLAGNLIAARPFDTVDDCLKVHGMGKTLLTRLQSVYESGEEYTGALEEENRAVVAVEKTPPAPIEKNPPAPEKPEDEQPPFLTRLWRAFVNFLYALLKLVITLAFLAAIGAALYYGIPYFNEKVIVPIERNATDIREMENKVAELQSQIEQTNARVDDIEKSIEAHTASLAQLEKAEANLEKEITANNNSVMVALKREMMFTRAIETLSRARLYLSQSNFGLAKQDVDSTRKILSDLKEDASDEEIAALDSILARLDLATGNLPELPVIAANDVDIAWELMMLGLSENAAK